MYAKVVITFFPPDKMEEAIRVYRDHFTPALRQQKGFKDVLFLTEHDTGKSISVILWETEADMTAGESNPFVRQQFDKFADSLGEASAGQKYKASVQA